MKDLKLGYFYVVRYDGEDLEQLSIGLDTYEDAEGFKKRYPNSFILCKVEKRLKKD